MNGLTRIIAVASGAADGDKGITLGEVVGATLETIARIIDRPAVNAATGAPITPEEVLAAIEKAERPFKEIVDIVDQELGKEGPIG